MMIDVCRRAVRRSRSLFAIASGMVVVSCSSAGGSGTADRADTGNSATPVLRTANGQQIFGTGGADSNSSNAAPSPGASPVGATPAESREAQQDPVLVSPDAGAGSSTPPAPRPPPSAAPVPQDPPGAASDDDDDDDDDESDDDD